MLFGPCRVKTIGTGASRGVLIVVGVVAQLALANLAVANLAHAQTGNPSRAAGKGCQWERAADKTAGLAAWVQRCDYGDRKIHFFFKGNALFQKYSDGGAGDALIEVFDLRPNEGVQAGVQRVYLSKTPKSESARCVIAPYTPGKAGAGAARYTFEPNVTYAKELKAKQDPNDIPDPPCGDWGTAPDGQQFFQAWPTGAVRRILFVRIGQDEPLFDEMTLQLLAATPAKAK
ncbi:MAG: hypothetical protein ABI120_12740 [Gemmatimonadaceae bacterium]